MGTTQRWKRDHMKHITITVILGVALLSNSGFAFPTDDDTVPETAQKAGSALNDLGPETDLTTEGDHLGYAVRNSEFNKMSGDPVGWIRKTNECRHHNWCIHHHRHATNEIKVCDGRNGHWCTDADGYSGFYPCNHGPPKEFEKWPHGECKRPQSIEEWACNRKRKSYQFTPERGFQDKKCWFPCPHGFSGWGN